MSEWVKKKCIVVHPGKKICQYDKVYVLGDSDSNDPGDCGSAVALYQKGKETSVVIYDRKNKSKLEYDGKFVQKLRRGEKC